MNRLVEFRDRSSRAPGGELRIYVGRASSKAELRILEARRELLNRLKARREYDTLQAVKAGTVDLAELERLVDQYGIGDYRAHLELTPPPEVPTLSDHVAAFLETVEKPRTRKTYRQGLAHLLAFEVDGEPLSRRGWHTIHAHHIRDAKAAMGRELARASVATYLGAWSAFFTWAVEREESEAAEEAREALREVNPVRKARTWVKGKSATRHRFLTREEFRRLLDASPPYMRAVYATFTLCGLRISELCHLPPGHVHPDRIHVGPTGSWAPKGWPESRRGVRDIPLHPFLEGLLKEYRELHAGDGAAFFVNPRTGGPWTESVLRRQFYKDARAAGLTTKSRHYGEVRPEGVTPHTLRHTFASWLVMADVQLLKVAHLMGDTMETVRKFYVWLLPSSLDESVRRLLPDALTIPNPPTPPEPKD